MTLKVVPLDTALGIHALLMITRADKDIVQFLSWSLLLAPRSVQGDQERPFLSRELRRGVLTQGEKRISRDRALVIGEERRSAVRGVCE